MSGRVRHDLLIVTCAVSAGVHAALTPAHFREGVVEGAGFAVATLLLAGLVVALTYRPASRAALVATALTFTGLLVSYLLAATSGIPLLHPDLEPVDRLALATKAVESLGLVLAVELARRLRPATPEHLPIHQLKGARS